MKEFKKYRPSPSFPVVVSKSETQYGFTPEFTKQQNMIVEYFDSAIILFTQEGIFVNHIKYEYGTLYSLDFGACILSRWVKENTRDV